VRTLIVLVAVLLAGALWFLLSPGTRTSPGPRTRDPAEVELEENPTLARGHEALTIWARAPDGSTPPGTEVGYRKDKSIRWLYAEADGHRTFTDAPLGEYEVVARAPGYPLVERKVVVTAGVLAEVTLLLRPERPH
jgi:hypothetical protein